MKRLISLFLMLSLTLLGAQLCMAASLGVGARAISMGGAFTAVADDGTAAYWNPAGISQVKMGATPSIGVQGNISNLLKIVGDQEIDLTDLEGSLNGVFGGGLTLRNFGFNVFGDVDANIQRIENGMLLKKDSTVQGTVTLAKEMTDLFALGVNAKYVYVSNEQMVQTVEEGQVKNEKNEKGAAVDLGGIFKIGKVVRLGAVLKDYPITSFELFDPPTKIVVGGAVKIPLAGLLIAADLETSLQGENTVYHLGIEQPIFGLVFLRAGGYKNDEGFNFTTGLGGKLGPVVIDVAAILGKEDPGIFATVGVKF